MFKKLFLTAVLCLCLVLASCSSVNEYGLSFAPDGSSTVDYIYFDEERVVYTVGGIMTAEINGNDKMLELALTDGEILVSEILASAQKDADNGDIETTEYHDGSIEYHYEGFDMIVLNSDGKNDIYFVPSEMSYYDVMN